MNIRSLALWKILLLLFGLSFTFFAIQSGDSLMYLALARDYFLKGAWPTTDPYLYSLAHAPLHTSHEYLSYLIFYGAYLSAGFAGMTILKMLLCAGIFSLALFSAPRQNSASLKWTGLFILAVLAASFRLIERSSLFSDLFCVLMVYWLVDERQVSRKLIFKLSLLFLLWVQLHPGFPLGLVLLGAWAAFNFVFEKDFRHPRVLWLALPALMTLINPLGLEGALYPIRFALNEAQVLKHSNFEWFPSYASDFRATPEVLAFWALLFVVAFDFLRSRNWKSRQAVFALVAGASAIQAVRFVPWASFALLIAAKPLYIRSPKQKPIFEYALAALLGLVIGHNLIFGYSGSSGPRLPRFGLDANFFPIHTLEFLRAHPIPGQLYNSHDFGSYLIWQNYGPIFHHGFVTDMDFYVNDVYGVFESQAHFLALQKKYGWTKLLVDKHGSYPYFFKILSPLPDWKIVSEDEASYLIYWLPDAH